MIEVDKHWGIITKEVADWAETVNDPRLTSCKVPGYSIVGLSLATHTLKGPQRNATIANHIRESL